MPLFRRDPERRADRQLERAERQRRAAATQRQRDKERAQADKSRAQGREVRGRTPLDWDRVGEVAGEVGGTLSDVFGGNKSAGFDLAADVQEHKGLWILGGIGIVGAVGAVVYVAAHSKPNKKARR